MRLICAEVVDEIKQAHPSRTVSFEGNGDLRGEWDPDRVEQVVSNLVGNAIVHGADPIVVTSRAPEDGVVTTVHNLGPPIPETVIPTLFEPFTRAGQEVADGHEGLGLGLYIVTRLTQALGGDRAGAEAGTQRVLAESKRVKIPNMLTASPQDVEQRVKEGFLGLLGQGAAADEMIKLGRAAAGR